MFGSANAKALPLLPKCCRACHGAIKFGDPLSFEQCTALINDLSECQVSAFYSRIILFILGEISYSNCCVTPVTAAASVSMCPRTAIYGAHHRCTGRGRSHGRRRRRGCTKATSATVPRPRRCSQHRLNASISAASHRCMASHGKPSLTTSQFLSEATAALNMLQHMTPAATLAGDESRCFIPSGHPEQVH